MEFKTERKIQVKENIILDKQLHATKGILNLHQLSPIHSVKNVRYAAKPNYGFWTSTFTGGKKGSDFLKEFPMDDADWYILQPSKADIFTVKNFGDIEHLLKHYGRKNFHNYVSHIDFEKLSNDFDALHLAVDCFAEDSSVKYITLYDENVDEFRTLDIGNSSEHPFFQWKAESTLWFNNKFVTCNKFQK
nr:hypothetical protein [Bacillus thuringiensis]